MKNTKRALDILLALAGLIVTIPFTLAISIYLLLTQGRIFFAHQRVGLNGVPFKCLKFGTMYADAQQRLDALLDNDPTIREYWKENHKLKKDPRIFPGGHFLRKTSLDELPQLINVIIGDMSIVGPRPVTSEELNEHYKEHAATYMQVRPGLTGPWQISGRNRIKYKDRVKIDVEYVRTQTMLNDLQIIIKTPYCMLMKSTGE